MIGKIETELESKVKKDNDRKCLKYNMTNLRHSFTI